jgi:hypothetical protein
MGPIPDTGVGPLSFIKLRYNGASCPAANKSVHGIKEKVHFPVVKPKNHPMKEQRGHVMWCSCGMSHGEAMIYAISMIIAITW